MPRLDLRPAPPTPDKPRSTKLVGRLGSAPRFHRNKAGLVAEVDIAVTDPTDPTTTIWHTCVAFGAKAEAMQRGYTKGLLVTAVGIPHQVERRRRDGSVRSDTQYYLVAPPKPKEPRKEGPDQ